MKLREYQRAAISDYFKAFKKAEDGKKNLLIVMPTGTGKSVVVAEIAGKFITSQPYLKILILTHTKELVKQNHEKFEIMYPNIMGSGICCSGLNRTDTMESVIFGTIGTVAKRLDAIRQVDLVIIDECHRVSLDKKSQYYKVIESLRKLKPTLPLIGLTATPYRAKQGLLIEGEDALFNSIACDYSQGDRFLQFINEGYLAELSTKEPSVEIDTTGVKTTGGDFNNKELDAASNQEAITREAVKNMITSGKNRRRWLIFAVSVEHCENIVAELVDSGIQARQVHSKMPEKERDANIQWVKSVSEDTRALVNVGVLSTGFDAPHIDLIGVLRPTKSVSLWVQIVGRGMRPVYADGYDLSTQEGRLEAQSNGLKPHGCLVLDFAGNCKRMGAINDVQTPSGKRKKKGGEAIMKTCPQCSEIVHSAVRHCPKCDHKFEFQTKLVETAHAGEIVKRKKEVAPKHEWFTVRSVAYSLHTKQGSPDMVKVTYNVGVGLLSKAYTEYLCLNHSGYARHKSLKWVTERLPDGCSESKHKALCHGTASFLTNAHLIKKPSSIQVWVNKKYPSITEYKYEGASNVSN